MNLKFNYIFQVNLNVLKIQTHHIITDYGFTGQWQNKPLPSENRISIKQLTSELAMKCESNMVILSFLLIYHISWNL